MPFLMMRNNPSCPTNNIFQTRRQEPTRSPQSLFDALLLGLDLEWHLLKIPSAPSFFWLPTPLPVFALLRLLLMSKGWAINLSSAFSMLVLPDWILDRSLALLLKLGMETTLDSV